MRLRAWREGVLAGTWDVINPIPSPDGAALCQWLEFKRPGQPLSPEQIIFRNLLSPYGHRFDVVDSVEEGLRVWMDHLQITIKRT